MQARVVAGLLATTTDFNKYYNAFYIYIHLIMYAFLLSIAGCAALLIFAKRNENRRCVIVFHCCAACPVQGSVPKKTDRRIARLGFRSAASGPWDEPTTGGG